MNKKIIISALFVLMIFSVVNAELIITPNTQDLSYRANLPSNFILNLQNTFDFKISNITFSNFTGISYPNIELNAGESKNITFTITDTSAGYKEINSKVSFKYSVNLPQGNSVHQVNITYYGYNPYFLTIRQGDTITWKNLDDITHTVTAINGLFSQSFGVNQSYSYTFNQVGSFAYEDLSVYFGGTIDVVNQTSEQTATNPAYDKYFLLRLTSILDETQLELTNSQSQYNVSATGSKEGLLQVKNIGTTLAQRVTLTSMPNWIRFEKNQIDIPAGSIAYVIYHIEPIIIDTNQTNQTYNLRIDVKGSNTGQLFTTSSVYIPFDGSFANINTNEGFLAFYSRYCALPENKVLFICNNTITENTNGTVIIRDTQLNLNYSQRDFLALVNREQRVEDTLTRTSNDVKTTNDFVVGAFGKIETHMNNTDNRLKDMEDNQIAKERAFWIFIFFAIIICAILIIGLRVRKWQSKRNMTTTGYFYK